MPDYPGGRGGHGERGGRDPMKPPANLIRNPTAGALLRLLDRLQLAAEKAKRR